MGTPVTSTYTAWFRPTLVTGPAETEYPAGKVCWLQVDVSGGQEEASDGAAAVATPPRADANTKRLRQATANATARQRILRVPPSLMAVRLAAISWSKALRRRRCSLQMTDGTPMRKTAKRLDHSAICTGDDPESAWSAASASAV